MKIYLVGGAVRDKLMGLTPKDKDYVAVGATEQDMINLGCQKVGKSFPVFIHPETGDEYALARTEAKTDHGNPHKAFNFNTEDVSLEEDLIRRDLTINAMALHVCPKSGEEHLIDPYNGQKDILMKTLRHVSNAFKEDPLRVLRVARFATKFPEFTIAPETLQVMREMTQGFDFKNLPAERVYQEMAEAMRYEKPSIFFEVLREVDGLHFFPELETLIDVPQNPIYHPEGDCWVHTMLVLDHAAKMKSDYREEIVFAALVHDLGKGITPTEILPKHNNHEVNGVPLVEEFCKRLRVPNNLRDAALIVTRNHLRVHRIMESKAGSIVKLFIEMGAFKNPKYVEILARACEADDMGKNREEVIQGIFLEKCFEQVRGVSIKDTRPGLKGVAIGHEIRSVRVNRLKEFLKLSKVVEASNKSVRELNDSAQRDARVIGLFESWAEQDSEIIEEKEEMAHLKKESKRRKGDFRGRGEDEY